MPNEAWFHRAVAYQIYPRSFADSDGDGIGDLRGITSRLDHLARLGVDVVWLSPIYRSPQDDNGYDIADYQDIDPVFGTLADFDELLAGLHRHDIKLVMDLVVNHTSDEHPWFVESRRDRTNARRDWYWWRPPAVDGGPPNNWRSAFSGSAWTLDEATGEYYLHLFSRKQPDLTWENPEVRQAVYAMMRWWLDRGVDGFRMDVINMISKDVTLPDGPVRPGERYGDPGPHTFCGPRVHEFLQEMRREVFAGRPGPLLTVGETPGIDVADARLFSDPARGELDMVFQFEHVDLDHDGSKWRRRPLGLVTLKRCLARWQDGLAATGWNSLYWSNHDQPRPVSRFGDDRPEHRVDSAKALGTILHLHRGTPYVYQGEELGMTNMAFRSLADFRDIETINHAAEALAAGEARDAVLASVAPASRDNARTPMQWDAGPHGGFSTVEPWLAVNPNHEEINAAAAEADPGSVLHHYRRLIALRHQDPVVAHGSFELLLEDDADLWAFTRTLGEQQLLVVANCSDRPRQVPFDGWADEETVLHTGPKGTEADVLGPWAARVTRRVVGR
ncbi:MAG: alpha-glucosidase [Acidimicrobiales bacterium]|nr:alpha-glucosidase [Acidimicrobiales bacterium]